MTTYQARIRQDATGSYYAMVVMTDWDGQNRVDNCYKPRFFATLKAAEKSTGAYIAKR